MNGENRIINASILAGLLDMLLGFLMWLTGYQFYYMHGVLGVGMIFYGLCHALFKYVDTGVVIWMRK